MRVSEQTSFCQWMPSTTALSGHSAQAGETCKVWSTYFFQKLFVTRLVVLNLTMRGWRSFRSFRVLKKRTWVPTKRGGLLEHSLLERFCLDQLSCHSGQMLHSKVLEHVGWSNASMLRSWGPLARTNFWLALCGLPLKKRTREFPMLGWLLGSFLMTPRFWREGGLSGEGNGSPSQMKAGGRREREAMFGGRDIAPSSPWARDCGPPG